MTTDANFEPATACAEQERVVIQFDAAEALQITQSCALGGEDSVIIVAGPNLRDFMGAIVNRYRLAFGNAATADLLDYVTEISGIPSNRGLSEDAPKAGGTNAERQRRFRQRRAGMTPVTRNADRNAGVTRNAPPLQPAAEDA